MVILICFLLALAAFVIWGFWIRVPEPTQSQLARAERFQDEQDEAYRLAAEDEAKRNGRP